MHIRTIRPQEVAAVRALCFTAFEANIDFTSSPQASAEQILHAPLTRMQQQYLNTFAAFDEQENPIATVAHCTQRARFDGGIVQMEAIGDVASLPQAQGTGAVRKMFAEILQQAYQQEIPFSYLYPFSEGYYARLGYSCCVKNHIWRLPLSHLPAMSYEGVCRPYLADQQMEAALEQVYSQAAKDWNLSVVREQPEWNRQLRLFIQRPEGAVFRLQRFYNVLCRSFVHLCKIFQDCIVQRFHPSLLLSSCGSAGSSRLLPLLLEQRERVQRNQ